MSHSPHDSRVADASKFSVLGMDSEPVLGPKSLPGRYRGVYEFFKRMDLRDFKVLDIGGTSACVIELRSVFVHADITPLNISRGSIESLSEGVVGDATRLPFADESWDIVASFDTVEHLYDPDSFLSESYRVLRKGGYFVLGTPNLADFYSRVTFLFGFCPFWYSPSKKRVGVPFRNPQESMGGHRSVFTHIGLSQLLSESGFVIENSQGYCYADALEGCSTLIPDYMNISPALFRGSSIRRMLGRVLPKTMREGMVFVCRKA